MLVFETFYVHTKWMISYARNLIPVILLCLLFKLPFLLQIKIQEILDDFRKS